MAVPINSRKLYNMAGQARNLKISLISLIRAGTDIAAHWPPGGTVIKRTKESRNQHKRRESHHRKRKNRNQGKNKKDEGRKGRGNKK